MKRRDRNSYTNTAIRELMRVHNQLARVDSYPPLIALLRRRMLECTLEALRFRYGQKSTWDVLFK